MGSFHLSHTIHHLSVEKKPTEAVQILQAICLVLHLREELCKKLASKEIAYSLTSLFKI